VHRLCSKCIMLKKSGLCLFHLNYIGKWYFTHFPAPIQTNAGAHPASYTVGTWTFAGLKQQGCGVPPPTKYSAKVKESSAISLLSLCAIVACHRVNFRFYLFIIFTHIALYNDCAMIVNMNYCKSDF
jgi:hypothetical protein